MNPKLLNCFDPKSPARHLKFARCAVQSAEMAFAKSTLRSVDFFRWFVTAFKLLPVQWNPRTGQCELVTQSTMYAVYLNVTLYFLYLLYIWTSVCLVRNGNLDSSFVDTEIHVTFALSWPLGFVAQMHLIWYRTEICGLINSTKQLIAYFNDKYKRSEPRKPKPTPSSTRLPFWEALLQMSIYSFTVAQPALATLFYFVASTSNRYPIWILIGNGDLLEPHALEVTCVFGVILAWQVILLLNVLYAYLIYIMHTSYLLLQWLDRITPYDTPKSKTTANSSYDGGGQGQSTPSSKFLVIKSKIHPSTLRQSARNSAVSILEAFHAYRCLQIQNQHYMSLIRPLIAPFFIFLVFSVGIMANYICIIHHDQIPVFVLSMWLNASVGAILLIFIAVPALASIHTNSLTFVKRWTRHVQGITHAAAEQLFTTKGQLNWTNTAIALGKDYNLAFLASCPPLKQHVGMFFYIKKSTTYKMVLFLILHTMKTLLMFGRKHRL